MAVRPQDPKKEGGGDCREILKKKQKSHEKCQLVADSPDSNLNGYLNDSIRTNTVFSCSVCQYGHNKLCGNRRLDKPAYPGQ